MSWKRLKKGANEFTYKERRAQLIEAGEPANDISRTLRDEYGIHFPIHEIEDIIKKNGRTVSIKPEKRIPDLILKFISDASYPVDLADIKEFLVSHSEFISIESIEKCINSDLREQAHLNGDGKALLFASWPFDKPKDAFGASKSTTPSPKKAPILSAKSEVVIVDLDPLIETFIIEARSQKLDIDTGVEQLNLAIKNIVRDNLITETEKSYILSKAEEYNYKGDILEKVHLATNMNNPYLDGIIQFIYDDGIITEDELRHLKRNAEQIGLLPKYLNRRFWTLSGADFSSSLITLTLFQKFLGLYHFGIEHIEGWEKRLTPETLSRYCDIYLGKSIEAILDRGVTRLTQVIAENTNQSAEQISSEIESIEFILNSKKHSEPEDFEAEANPNHAKFLRILKEEGERLGDPQANLLIQNVLFRLNHE